MERVVKHWNRPSREVLNAPSLLLLKKHLDFHCSVIVQKCKSTFTCWGNNIMWCFNICNQVNYFLDWKNVLCRFKVIFEYKASSALAFPNWGNMNMSYIHLINSQFASSAGKLNPVMFASDCITLWRWDYRDHIEKLKLLTKKVMIDFMIILWLYY